MRLFVHWGGVSLLAYVMTQVVLMQCMAFVGVADDEVDSGSMQLLCVLLM